MSPRSHSQRAGQSIIPVLTRKYEGRKRMKFSELVKKWELGWRGKAEDVRSEIWDFSDSIRIPIREADSKPSYITRVGENWTIIQQSVTFLEAVKAYSEGKTIRYELDGCYREFCPCGLKNAKASFLTQEILNGKWFIEA
jgi:hypothetical protein